MPYTYSAPQIVDNSEKANRLKRENDTLKTQLSDAQSLLDDVSRRFQHLLTMLDLALGPQFPANVEESTDMAVTIAGEWLRHEFNVMSGYHVKMVAVMEAVNAWLISYEKPEVFVDDYYFAYVEEQINAYRLHCDVIRADHNATILGYKGKLWTVMDECNKIVKGAGVAPAAFVNPNLFEQPLAEIIQGAAMLHEAYLLLKSSSGAALEAFKSATYSVRIPTWLVSLDTRNNKLGNVIAPAIPLATVDWFKTQNLTMTNGVMLGQTVRLGGAPAATTGPSRDLSPYAFLTDYTSNPLTFPCTLR